MIELSKKGEKNYLNTTTSSQESLQRRKGEFKPLLRNNRPWIKNRGLLKSLVPLQQDHSHK